MSRYKLERKYNIQLKNVSPIKLEVITAGDELGYLKREDVEYIASDRCNDIQATNILIDRRRAKS